MQTCYRHPSEETGVSCSSCGRPICTECMTATNVGMRCPECSKQKTKVRTAASFAPARPQVTFVLVAVNILVFFAQVLTGENGADSGEVYNEGALRGYEVHLDGEWWRMLTAGFLHADPMHIIFNMIGVYFLGQLLEPALGSVRFAAVYFASLLAGSFGALLLDPDVPVIGASGAVFGLLGAAFIIMRQRGVDPMQTFIGPILILNIVITFAFSGTISVGGHIGGLIGGGLCALVIGISEQRRSQLGAVLGCVAIGVVAAVGGIVAAGTPSLY
jgi:membrane associated rhomboid family serine protease